MALSQPDRRTLDDARDGDERAFACLMEAYHRPVLGYVYRMVGDAGLAEDLAQDVFLRVYQRLDGFRGQCQFTTWLFQIAKNRVLDELRAQARRPSAPFELSESTAGHGHPPERNGEIDEAVGAIWQAVSRLDVDLKMPLLLRDVAGLSYREICETLDIPLATVKWRIYSARESIQHALAAHDISPDFARAAEPHRSTDQHRPAAEAGQPALVTLPT